MTQTTSLKGGNSKDDSSPFGESGDISDALENIFDSAIKKFVDKYKGSSKIREKMQLITHNLNTLRPERILALEHRSII